MGDRQGSTQGVVVQEEWNVARANYCGKQWAARNRPQVEHIDDPRFEVKELNRILVVTDVDRSASHPIMIGNVVHSVDGLKDPQVVVQRVKKMRVQCITVIYSVGEVCVSPTTPPISPGAAK